MRGRDHRLALAALLLAATALHLFTLLRFPQPFVDDAWYASRAWALIQTGRAFSVLDAGVLDRYPGYWTYFPILGPLFQAPAIRALGPSLFSARLTSLAFGLALLLAVYAIGSRLSGGRAGLIAVLLVSLSRPFLESAHLGRPDIMAAAFGYTAIALYVTDRPSGWPLRSALSGLLVGLAFEIHPNAMVYGPAILALMLMDHGRGVLRARRLWGFAAGAVVGLLTYAALHVVRYPQTYLTITQIIVGSSRVPPILIPSPREWLNSLMEVGLLLVWSTDLRAALVLAAVVALARLPSLRRIPALFAALGLAFAALVSNKASYYAILTAPAADILVAAFLAELLARRERAARKRPALNLAIVLAFGIAVASVAFSLSAVRANPFAEYQAVVARLQQALPSGSSVLGSQTYWFGLTDRRYSSWENLVYYQHATPGSTLEEALLALRPDYLLLDEHVDGLVADDVERLVPYYRFVAVSREELARFLARRGQLCLRIETDVFGDVRLYKLYWQ